MIKSIRDFFKKSEDNAAKKYENMTAEEVFECGTEMIGKQPIDEVKQTFVIAKQKGHPFAKDMLFALDVQEKEEREVAIFTLYGALKKVPEFVYGMGNAYEHGSSGYPQSYEDAVRWYRMAAEMGHPKAQCNLGWCYAGGHGVIEDDEEARKWYLKAAINGDMIACANLYDMYWREEDYENCRRQAAHILIAGDEGLEDLERIQDAHINERAAQCGDMLKALEFESSIGNLKAKCYLAYHYHKNEMYEKAFPLLVECAAVKEDVPDFLYFLGESYMLGRGTKVDEEEGIRLLCKAAKGGILEVQTLLEKFDIDWENNGDDVFDCLGEDECEAMCQQATELYEEKRYEEAAQLLQNAVDNQYAPALVPLAAIFANGEGVEQDYDKAFKLYLAAANLGIAFAQREVGTCYSRGYGANKDMCEAAKWYAKAAELNNPDAQVDLASCYLSGNGVEKDVTKAYELFNRAAKQNHPDGLYGLAYIFIIIYSQDDPDKMCTGLQYLNEAVAQGHAKAKELLNRLIEKLQDAAIQGDAKPQCWLGMCLQTSDIVRANELILQSAEQGYSLAQTLIGMAYIKGEGVRDDTQEGVNWLLKAAKQDSKVAQFVLGMLFMNGAGGKPYLVESLEWLHKAAENDSEDAQKVLGQMYLHGDKVKADIDEAVKWFRKAAEHGDALSQFEVGLSYLNGEGSPRDYVEAVKWLRKAAEQGYAPAQYELAVCYRNGEGGILDFVEAVKWYREAAAQGDAGSLYSLGACHYSGLGVKKSEAKAIKCFKKAAELGDEDAIQALKQLSE